MGRWLFALLLGACTRPIELDGRRCPCTEGWSCCASLARCIRPADECPPAAGEWTREDSGLDPPPALYSVWGDDAGRVFAVGDEECILSSAGDGTWTVEHHRPQIGASTFESVQGTADTVVATGSSAAVYRRSPSGEWTRTTSLGLAAANLSALWASPTGELWAAAGRAQVYRSSSAAEPWVELTPGQPNPLYAATIGPLFAGEAGVIVTQRSGTWAVEDSGVGGTLHAAFRAGSLVVVVGTAGAIGRFDGTWHDESVAGPDLWAVTGNAGKWYAVGANGRLLQSSGDGHWTEAAISTRTLRGLWRASAGDLFAVGDGGEILHRR